VTPVEHHLAEDVCCRQNWEYWGFPTCMGMLPILALVAVGTGFVPKALLEAAVIVLSAVFACRRRLVPPPWATNGRLSYRRYLAIRMGLLVFMWSSLHIVLLLLHVGFAAEAWVQTSRTSSSIVCSSTETVASPVQAFGRCYEVVGEAEAGDKARRVTVSVFGIVVPRQAE
jgi:hypothetical protein